MNGFDSIRLAKETGDKVEPLRKFWESRNRQWSLDRSLLLMQYKARMMPFEQIISSEPAINHAGAVAILGGKPPNFRLPITIQEQTEGIKHDKSERLAYGMFREWDKRWRLQGHNPWLLDFLFYACMGAVAGLPQVVKRKGRPVEFHCPLFDPMTVYPSFGEDGLGGTARIYRTEWNHAVSIAKMNGWDMAKVKEAKDIEIINFWEMGDEDKGEDPEVPHNLALMGGIAVQDRVAHDEFKRIPLFIAPFNGVPWRGFDNAVFINSSPGMVSAKDWTANWGRPIFWANRQLYRDLDRLLSYEAERARRSAHGQYLAKTQGGRTLIEGSVADLEVITVDVEEGEEFGPIPPPSQPSEHLALIDQLFSMSQRGGLNRLALGDLNLEISGVTLERAAASARFILEPYAEGSASTISDILMSMFEQIRSLNIRKLSLETRKESMGAELAYVIEEFSKKDIPETTYVEVTLPMLLPDDRMRKATIARTLIPGNIPLAGSRYVAETVLGIQDWTQMQEEIKEDMASQHPAMVQVELMAAIRRKIEDWSQTPGMEGAAEEAQMALAIMRESFRATFAPREQAPSTQPGRERQPAPSEQPPEERGAASSDQELIASQPSGGADGEQLRNIVRVAQGGAGRAG